MRVTWTGGPGGAGVSTFHALDGPALVAPMQAFFTALKTSIPDDIVITVPSGGDTFDHATGTLTGSWGTGNVFPIINTYAAAFAAASGLLLRWATGAIVNGHRLVGKTYIVPVSQSSFDNSGNVLAATRLAVTGFMTTLIAAQAGNLVVWSRPAAGRQGEYRSVATGDVSLKGAVLRSRRD